MSIRKTQIRGEFFLPSVILIIAEPHSPLVAQVDTVLAVQLALTGTTIYTVQSVPDHKGSIAIG